jgi:uncharacterized repeat protein (TIGR03803 family)
MHPAGTNSWAKRRLNVSDGGPSFGSTKLAAATTRGTLTLAVVLSALLLIAARPAQAQTETVLYNFAGGSDGANPLSRLTSDGAGNFYGTTQFGGLGYGTVFELSPNGNGGWKETVLYSFSFTDGAYPNGSDVIFDSVGNLYGTASAGGAHQYGVVFELSPAGASWQETVLYSFCPEGYPCNITSAEPLSGVIMDKAGNLYGTTFGAINGDCENEQVFELSPPPGGWTEKLIYAHQNGKIDNIGLSAGLTMDAAGNIFGVGYSTVFELSPNGSGGWNPSVIHHFKDFILPEGTPAIDKAGNLYGTTTAGGAKGYGTVYKLSPAKNGKWKDKIVYSFKSGKDGNDPWSGVLLDAAGNLYGSTTAGGEYNAGTVFELVAPVGKDGYKEKVLWSFTGTDGSQPYGSLTLGSAGNLYGTTAKGGSSGYGVVFEVAP